MDTQQMLELLLTKIDANQEKAEADRKTDKEEIKTGHKELLAKMEADRKIDKEERKADRAQTQQMMKMLQAYQAKTDAILPATQVMETNLKETTASFKPETDEVETMACQGMEARPEEKPTSADRKPEAVEEYKALAENATVIPVGEPKKKRRRDRKLAAEHRRQKPKTSTRENCGSQKRLDVTRRGTSHRATVARKMQADQKMPRRPTVARRMSDIFRPNITLRVKVARQTKETGREMPGRPRIAWRKKSVGRRNRIEAMIERATQRVWPLMKNFTNTATLEIAKRTIGSTVERRARKNWTLWRGRPPPKRKKRHGLMGGTGGKSTGLPSENE
jgi:hypothetical protein